MVEGDGLVDRAVLGRAPFHHVESDLLQAVVSPQQRLDATSRIHAASETQNGVDLHSALLATKVQEFIPEPNRSALVQFLSQRRIAGPQVVCSAIGVPILPFGDAK